MPVRSSTAASPTRIRPETTMGLARVRRTILRLRARVLMAAGFDFYRETDDRRLLQRVILPGLAADPSLRNILFVGCDWYTRGYRRAFRGRRYVTLDHDPVKRKYGAGEHIVDDVAHLGRHFNDGALDLILCNGVLGYGLDDRWAVDAAFAACFRALRLGGLLLLGWNDVPERRPVHPDECASLSSFERFVFPPLGSSRILTATANRHTYDFYAKP